MVEEKNIGRKHKRIKRTVHALLLEEGAMTAQQIISRLKHRPRSAPSDRRGAGGVRLNHNTPSSNSLAQIMTCCPALFRKAGMYRGRGSRDSDTGPVTLWEAVE